MTNGRHSTYYENPPSATLGASQEITLEIDEGSSLSDIKVPLGYKAKIRFVPVNLDNNPVQPIEYFDGGFDTHYDTIDRVATANQRYVRDLS